MRIDIFSVIPETMLPYLESSMLAKATTAKLLDVRLHNLRDHTTDKHRTTDDVPYGGGGGMVMKPEPVFTAVEAILGVERASTPIILLTPQGEVFEQKHAAAFSKLDRLAFICGRYEGVDERIREHLATHEISIGDYVLTGGELPALVIIDAVVRLIPGVLGDEFATSKDSHSAGLLEHPHYTRPAEYRGWRVPEVLRSGDHERVSQWRQTESLRRTFQRRPDLLDKAKLSINDKEIIQQLHSDQDEEDHEL